MRRHSVVLGCGGFVLVLAAWMLVGTATSGQADDTLWRISDLRDVAIPAGPIEDVDPHLLIPAYADDGTLGYVRATDLFPPSATGGDALAHPVQAADAIPVYAADGVTVIGTNTATPAEVSYDAADTVGPAR